MSLPNEQAIVKRASEGDMSAFEVLVETYETRMYNTAVRMVSNSEDAMDIVQDVFVKVYKALPRFRGDSKFSTWIYRICVNTSLDHLRKRKKVQIYSLDAPIILSDSEVQRQVEDLEKNTEKVVETRLLGEKVLDILNDLDFHYRVVLILCDVQGYSYQEISEILNISLGTVKSRIHRARNIVRKLIDEEQIFPPNVKQDERGDGK